MSIFECPVCQNQWSRKGMDRSGLKWLEIYDGCTTVCCKCYRDIQRDKRAEQRGCMVNNASLDYDANNA